MAAAGVEKRAEEERNRAHQGNTKEKGDVAHLVPLQPVNLRPYNDTGYQNHPQEQAKKAIKWPRQARRPAPNRSSLKSSLEVLVHLVPAAQWAVVGIQIA